MKIENSFFKLDVEVKRRRPVIVIALLLVVAIVGGCIFTHLSFRKDVQQAKAEVADAADISNSAVAKTEADASGVNAEVSGGNKNGENQNSEDGENAASGEDTEEDVIEEYGQIDGEYVVASKLATGIQEKYADRSLYNYTYADPIENVEREESIEFKVGYDVNDLGIEYWREVYALYEDPELEHEMNVKYSFDTETKTFIMQPSETDAPFRISTMSMDVETVNRYPHNVYYLFNGGAGTTWGNLGTAYLACYRDKETGEILEKPEVSIVTFAGEIEEAPKLNYSITEDGRPEFYWNEVDGAKEYMVCRTSRTEGGGSGSLQVIGITEDTTWTTEPAEFNSWATTNSYFKTFFLVSEDDWNDESMYDYYMENYGNPGVPNHEDGEWTTKYGICVIAVNEEGTSMISNVYTNEELAPNLPYAPAAYTRRANNSSPGKDYETVESLPVYDYVTMCDGYTATKVIDYQTEKAYIQDERFYIVDSETGEYIKGETVPCLNIPYQVLGTPFYYEYQVQDYDVAKLKEDLAFLEEREAALVKKSGDVSPEFSLRFATQDDLKPVQIRRVESDIVANSALSEYIATNMLGGVNVIDVSDFPEAADKRLVDDAFLEAYYQNPLILGIKGYRISKKGTAIRVVYEESLESQAEKQQAIQEKVEEIIAEIITDDMTDREKELAINSYLCERLVYDNDALENAEENDFMFVDDKYNDSFNAYGALINEKCVCAGYAAAFHLLAREAGLESIVVTGFLDGSLAHAWNKVKIDGEWQIVDVTNNDNEYFYNALFNLPSSVGNRILVEDKDYAMDAMIREYTGESDANEYYHITENYFPTQEVAERLAAELAEKGEVTLRTDYALDDNEFYEITEVVYDIMGDDIELYGYHWLGVIYLSLEE